MGIFTTKVSSLEGGNQFITIKKIVLIKSTFIRQKKPKFEVER